LNTDYILYIYYKTNYKTASRCENDIQHKSSDVILGFSMRRGRPLPGPPGGPAGHRGADGVQEEDSQQQEGDDGGGGRKNRRPGKSPSYRTICSEMYVVPRAPGKLTHLNITAESFVEVAVL
jgi:hypothetical protein